jgi:hypothetical protein
MNIITFCSRTVAVLYCTVAFIEDLTGSVDQSSSPRRTSMLDFNSEDDSMARCKEGDRSIPD